MKEIKRSREKNITGYLEKNENNNNKKGEIHRLKKKGRKAMERSREKEH